MRLQWLGWVGLAGLLVLLSFFVFTKYIPSPIGNILLPASMGVSIVCPIIASFRASKWWLLLSLCGLATTVMFFWMISA